MIHPVYEDVLQDIYRRFVDEYGVEIVTLDWKFLDKICENVAYKQHEKDKVAFDNTEP